jgi:hypothetical protein
MGSYHIVRQENLLRSLEKMKQAYTLLLFKAKFIISGKPNAASHFHALLHVNCSSRTQPSYVVYGMVLLIRLGDAWCIFNGTVETCGKNLLYLPLGIC